jgi:hypothetical protein
MRYPVPSPIAVEVQRRMIRADLHRPERPHDLKWLRFCFVFCHKYGHLVQAEPSLKPFLPQLAWKHQWAPMPSDLLEVTLSVSLPGPANNLPPPPASQSPASIPASASDRLAGVEFKTGAGLAETVSCQFIAPPLASGVFLTIPYSIGCLNLRKHRQVRLSKEPLKPLKQLHFLVFRAFRAFPSL